MRFPRLTGKGPPRPASRGAAVRRLKPTDCRVVVDAVECDARAGETVSATLLATGRWRPLQCGMGACFACTVTIDGIAGRRACIELTRPGMVIATVAAHPLATPGSEREGAHSDGG